jgi:hypothetical protein
MSAVSGAPFRRDYQIDSITVDEGIRLKGSMAGEYTGTAVCSGGDVDGDGVDDFVVGAQHAGSLLNGTTEAGRAYVLYGVANSSDATTAWPTDTTIKAIALDNSTRGRIIDGAVAGAKLGMVVAIVGDVNGDRLDDIAIGSSGWNSNQGKVRLVWGKPRDQATNPLFVDVFDASEFVEITGEATSNFFGFAISSGGDFNHDGFSDLLISAWNYLN